MYIIAKVKDNIQSVYTVNEAYYGSFSGVVTIIITRFLFITRTR